MLGSDVLGRLPDLLRAVAVDDGRPMSASEVPERGLRLLRVPLDRRVEVPHVGRAVDDVYAPVFSPPTPTWSVRRTTMWSIHTQSQKYLTSWSYISCSRTSGSTRRAGSRVALALMQ